MKKTDQHPARPTTAYVDPPHRCKFNPKSLLKKRRDAAAPRKLKRTAINPEPTDATHAIDANNATNANNANNAKNVWKNATTTDGYL
jgi:hypothetical protein